MSDGFDPILQQAEQRRLREQVLWRLGIAAGLIGVVLGGIYLLDRPDEKPQLETSPSPRIAPQVTEAPVLPTLLPVASAVAASAPEASEASAAITAAPTAIPTVAPSPTPAASRVPTAAAATPPPTSTPILGKVPKKNTPAAPVPPVAAIATVPPVPSVQSVAVPINPNPPRRAENPAAANALLQPQTLLTGPSGSSAVEAVHGPSGYTVQAGVFQHADNAEKLLKRLQAANVPAYLETRVQIGPFKNKAEADAAAAKLRALGIEPVLKNN